MNGKGGEGEEQAIGVAGEQVAGYQVAELVFSF